MTIEEKNDMDPNIYMDNSGRTPLIAAVENDHIDVVELLLTGKEDPDLLRLDHSRADPNEKDFYKRTALSIAAENDNTDITKSL